MNSQVRFDLFSKCGARIQGLLVGVISYCNQTLPSWVARLDCQYFRLALSSVVAVLCNFGQASAIQSSLEIDVDYESQIRPILQRHCVECHGANQQNSDLRLDFRSAILAGASSGKIIEVGHSDRSRLIQVIDGRDPDYRMPPDEPKLSSEEIATLSRWIDQGAVGPDDSDAIRRQVPWSFSPLQPSEGPSGAAGVDYWLASKLREQRLTVSPQASRQVLARRLFLVVLGVPPTPTELQQFLEDDSPVAYPRLVERVLADPRYGERMARHWLDVVRFAESNGFETNRVRYNAWPYRDYVIAAFNDDLPYDQFVREQIAGDQLNADEATGFLVAGTYDLVKSPDINLTLMQRQDELTDLVNTTGTAFMALTLGCAKCHDHKFDPISQHDFYAMQGLLAGVHFGDRKVVGWKESQNEDELRHIRSQLADIERHLAQLRQVAVAKQVERALRPAVNSKQNSESFTPITTRVVRFVIQRSGGTQPCLDEWEIYNTSGTNVGLSAYGSVASASSTLPGYAIHQLQNINDGLTGNDHSWISNETDGGIIQISFPAEETIAKMNWGRDRSERFTDRLVTNYLIQAQRPDGQWQTIASGDDRQQSGEAGELQLLEYMTNEDRTQYELLNAQRAPLVVQMQSLSTEQSYWLGTFQQPPPTHRLHRGDPAMPREEVPPGTLAELNPVLATSESFEAERRLTLARWLTDAQNPLTPRVIVNRLWHYTFGTGIVDTPSDFGINGSRPTHPELLDHLAWQLVSNNWSLKEVHRSLLNSTAFMQSSVPNDEAIAVDADSRLLWRFPPRRLEAEAIRDSVLSVTESMDWRMGGPGFFLQIVEQDNVYRYFPKIDLGPDEFRRMVYMTRIRGEQDAVFGAFDCPSGNQVVPKRSRSNTPLQALNLFNSEFMSSQADLFARRLESRSGGDPVKAVQNAYRVLLCRDPDEDELEMSKAFIDEHGWQAYCRAMLNCTEFLFVF